MTTHHYEQVKQTGYKTVKCAGCGKRLQRQKTVMRTLNPFNKNADGSVKNRYEVMADNAHELKAWRKERVFCDKCMVGGERAFYRREK